MGDALSGQKVMLFWPDEGGWWEADVVCFNAASEKHRSAALLAFCLDEGQRLQFVSQIWWASLFQNQLVLARVNALQQQVNCNSSYRGKCRTWGESLSNKVQAL